jgi:hypothetical protein
VGSTGWGRCSDSAPSAHRTRMTRCLLLVWLKWAARCLVRYIRTMLGFLRWQKIYDGNRWNRR